MSDKVTLTTTAGAPIADNQNAITAGRRDPVLLQDYQLLEKLAHQNRERIPERTVHAKGWGAHGTFTVTHDITKVHQGEDLLADRQENRADRALLDHLLIAVGLMELDRNADDYFTEIELAAFSPSNMVSGISWSPDRMLQARIFSYADAHRYRLGMHYEALPVNRPRCPVHYYHKDGLMRFFEPTTGNPDAFYEPNSFNGPVEDPRFVEPPLRLAGNATRYNHREGNDRYRQPGDLFRLIGKEAQQRLVNNVAGAMQGVPREIVERQLGHFAKADPKYAEGVAQALGMAFRQAAE